MSKDGTGAGCWKTTMLARAANREQRIATRARQEGATGKGGGNQDVLEQELSGREAGVCWVCRPLLLAGGGLRPSSAVQRGLKMPLRGVKAWLREQGVSLRIAGAERTRRGGGVGEGSGT
ncbi:MAG: hypothetical protein M3Y50_09465 [Acidobacteriota bacterium]|nr:hypothetical protein [Acidobacteriota bacterium]